MPLVTANQYDLVPQFSNIGTGFAQGMQIGNQFRQNKLQDEAIAAEQAKQAQISQFSQAALGGDADARKQLSVLDPEKSKQLESIFAGMNEQQKAEALRENENMTRGALNIIKLSGNDPAKARVALQNQINEWKAQGLDTTRSEGALALDDGAMMQAIQEQASKGMELAELSKGVLMPEGQKLTTLQQNLQAAGVQPGTEEYKQTIIQNITKPQTQISIGGDKKFQEKVSEENAKTYGRLTEEADAAIDANQSLEVLSSIDVDTGALEPLKQGMAAFATSFGLDGEKIAKVSAGEAFNAEAKRLILAVKATQKGPQTDKDEATIRETVANLGNTPDGNKFIIASAKALNDRKIERKEFYDSFIQENEGNFRDSSGKTADQAWAEYKRGVPMISSTMRTDKGLPVFFYEFESIVRSANPDATRSEIIQAWKDRNGGKK